MQKPKRKSEGSTLANAKEGVRITEDIYRVKHIKEKSHRQPSTPRSARKPPEIRSRSHSPSDQDSSDTERYINREPGYIDVCKPIRHEIQTVTYLDMGDTVTKIRICLLYTSPSPRDRG